MINDNFAPAAKRLRRKLEILRLDFKASNSNRKHDIDECLSLLSIMENASEKTVRTSVPPADVRHQDRPAEG